MNDPLLHHQVGLVIQFILEELLIKGDLKTQSYLAIFFKIGNIKVEVLKVSRMM